MVNRLLKMFITSWVALLAISFTYPLSAAVTNLVATVDKNPVMLDESVQLIVTATGEVNNSALNLSSLDNDFRRSRTSISRSTQTINFNTTKTTTWSTQLFPKATGRFTIPSFEIDGQRSQAFEVLVVPVSNAQGSQTRQYYVTSEVDKSEVYLQQQIKYTVKIHLATDIQRGSLQAPELSGAEIKQLGEDKEYQDIRNGVRYRVIERVFAIIPQSSGDFEIKAPIFQGEVLTDSRQGFGFFERTKTISRAGQAQQIKVRPIPDNFGKHWLPSEFVQLNEEWQTDDFEFVVGEPITRTLTLTAAGLVEEQLPEINALYPPMFKTYPDQASTATVDRQDLLFAQRIENTAIIPNQPGQFVIPEVSVPWFNVLTETTEYATIPARSVTVINSPTSSNNSTTISPPSTTSNQSSETSVQTLKSGGLVNSGSQFDKLDWILMSSNLFFMALATVLFLKRRAPIHTRKTPEQSERTELSAWHCLVNELKRNDVEQIQNTLLIWLQQVTNSSQPSTVIILDSLGANEVTIAYNQMLSSKYSASRNNQWTSNEIKQALTALRSKLTANKKRSPVDELYQNNA